MSPTDGLIVLSSKVIEFAISPMYFGTEAARQDEIAWQYRQMKHDGTYTDWGEFENDVGRGTTFATTMEGGIYQVRADIEGTVYEYKWRADEPTATGSRKKGDPDHIGVCDEQWQITVSKEARKWLGNTEYRPGVYLPRRHGFSAFDVDSFKCNAFVAHQCTAAGAIVPRINGRLRWGPPTANQWAGVESTLHDGTFSSVIYRWELLPEDSFPQPGYVVSLQGHCGILDYDGVGIGAGSRDTPSGGDPNVNRRYDFSYGRYRLYTP
jgi:hypothetical protein